MLVNWRVFDSVHEIVDIKLRDEARLERFKNGAGVPYSAIYIDDTEVASCSREREDEMIRW